MRKILAKILGVVSSLAIIAGTCMPVSAESYTYTVKFRTGAQGAFTAAGVTIQGADSVSYSMSADNTVLTISGIPYGARVTFDKNSVALKDDSKYYVKGIRESGKDNNTISATSFAVEGDLDYVVGYALKTDIVAYTIKYEDREGNALAPAETHYGNVGDRPVVAYLYMDGFVPNAYNLTGELYADANENVFKFVYTPISELDMIYLGYRDNGTIIDGGVIVIPGNGGAGAGAGAGAGVAGNGGAGAAGNGGAGADGNGGAVIDDNNTPAASGPAEMIDIRDEESALASGNILSGLLGENGISVESPSAFFTSIPVGAKIATTAGLVAIVGVAAYFLFIRKAVKKKNDK